MDTPTLTVAQRFQEFFRNSEFKAFDNRDHSGCWRFLTVRTSQLGHVMVIISMYTQQLSPEQLVKVKQGKDKAIEGWREDGGGFLEDK